MLSITLAAHATPPRDEPIDQAFDRFCKNHVLKTEELLRELRARCSKPEMDPSGSLDVIAKCLSNVTSDDIPGVQRAFSEASGKTVPYWLGRTTTDLMDIRRTVDRLLIMNLANSRLQIDEPFQKMLNEYWKAEEYFSWRFRHEADLRTDLPH